jgi:hypothetical protein
MMIADDKEDCVMKGYYLWFVLVVTLCFVGLAWGSDLASDRQTRYATTLETDVRDGCGPVFEVSSLPYDTNANLIGAGDNCGIRLAQDHIYHVIIPQTGSYTFSLCGSVGGYTDTYIYLMTQCCGGTEIARDNDGCGITGGPATLECVTLNRGDYYLVVEAAYVQAEGPYSLSIATCSNPCDDAAYTPGTNQLDDVRYQYVQTVDANSLPPNYSGPFVDSWPCSEDGGYYGFDLLSWFNNDFGWMHTWSGYNDDAIVSIDSAFVYICAWDVDEPCPTNVASRQIMCEIDQVSLYGSPNLPTQPPYLDGHSQAWSVTRFSVPIYELTMDGMLNVWLNIDALAQSCNWALNVHRSQLVVYYTLNRPPAHPEVTTTGCATTDSTICVTPYGPVPADPDGDNVTYEYRWFLWNAGLNDWVLQPSLTDSCVPPSETNTFDTWKVEVRAIDEHQARSDSAVATFNIVEDCGSNPILGFDFGDLDTCYQTYDVDGGGPSHPIRQRDNVAWLGDTMSVDVVPNILNQDTYDDGVVFLNPNDWVPCEQVCVEITVTTGSGFNPDLHSLYLFGYKDGSFPPNCSFQDRFCEGNAYECLIQGAQITGMAANSTKIDTFCFTDPGVQIGQGRYDGIFRFRLVTENLNCVQAIATNDPVGGETEDYIVNDLQLAVELMSFTAVQDGEAVVLRWSTASEKNNDYFRVERRTSGDWTTVSSRISGAGTSTVSHSYSYRDASVEAGRIYEYRLVSVDINGTAQVIATESIPVTQSDPATVNEYRLYANYPNPFNPSTTIAFDLVEAGHVDLRVYDIMGREVAVLVNGTLSSGRHREVFEAKDLPSGLYMYKLTAGNFVDMKKMILLK